MYGKVFETLWAGTLRGRSAAQLVFVYLISHAEPDGTVEVVRERIADDTGLGRATVDAAIGELEAADPESRSNESEGARLARLDERSWGWQIVNYLHYRGMVDGDTKRHQDRLRQARRRERLSRPVTDNHARSRQEEVEVEEENLNTLVPAERGNASESSSNRNKKRKPKSEREPAGFAAFYDAYPRHDGRRTAAREFGRALHRRGEYSAADLQLAATQFAAQVRQEDRELRFIPLPATWLSQDRFREFFDEEESEPTHTEPTHTEPTHTEPTHTETQEIGNAETQERT